MTRLTFRPARPDDSEFAYRTREAAFRALIDQGEGWDEAAQRALHDGRFGRHDFRILEWGDERIAVGILVIEPADECIHIHQLFLLPEHQGRGIGRAVLEKVVAEFARLRRPLPLRLRCRKANPRARAFYERLGFRIVGEDGPSDLLERPAEQTRKVVMEPSRKIPDIDIDVFPLVIGGHSFSSLPDKVMPTAEEAVAILETLVAGGVSHFDCTWKSERQAYRHLLERSGLRERLQPIIWHGWHEYEERTADDIVHAFRGVLGELGYERASLLVINQWDHTEAHQHFYVNQDRSQGFADWFWEGIEEIKRLGLAEGIGWAVEPGPLNAPFLMENHARIDFVALYWNYRNRQNQHLVELARAYRLGIYAVAPFGRGGGSLFKVPGIDPDRILKPWLKWVLQEPSVFAMPISLPNLAEARQTLAAFDGTAFDSDDAETLRMNQ